MPATETIRVTIKTDDDLGSALKIWTQTVQDFEPTAVETDDDGDTYARGQVQGIWLEIAREAGFVTLTYSAIERDRDLYPIVVFEDEDPAVDHARLMVSRITEHVAVGQLEYEVYQTDICSGISGTMNRIRELLPQVRFPEGTQDAHYKISVLQSFGEGADIDIVLHANWRNGRRAYTTDNEQGERIYVDAAGLTASCNARSQNSENLSLPASHILEKLISRVDAVRQGGIDAI